MWNRFSQFCFFWPTLTLLQYNSREDDILVGGRYAITIQDLYHNRPCHNATGLLSSITSPVYTGQLQTVFSSQELSLFSEQYRLDLSGEMSRVRQLDSLLRRSLHTRQNIPSPPAGTYSREVGTDNIHKYSEKWHNILGPIFRWVM